MRGATSRRPSREPFAEQPLLLGEIEVQHQGSRPAAEEDSRRFVLSRNCSVMRKRFEHPLDVTVEERPLLTARRRVHAVGALAWSSTAKRV